MEVNARALCKEVQRYSTATRRPVYGSNVLLIGVEQNVFGRLEIIFSGNVSCQHCNFFFLGGGS